jgi:replicative DNA helicase
MAKSLRSKDKPGSVLIFSLEMSAESLMRRMASLLSGVSTVKMRRGESISETEYQAFCDACEVTYDLPLIIDDSSGLTPAQLVSKARKVEREQGLSAIFVDYLGLMTLGRKTGTAAQNMDEIARELKAIARQLGVPLFALSQLSRACETRDNKRPTMSDIRDSGQIEANADLVMLLYRDSYYRAKEEQRKEGEVEEAEVIIAKQRNGETGTVRLAFEPHFTRYRPIGRSR